MKRPSPDADDRVTPAGPRLVAFGLLTLAVAALCVRMAWPFLPALTWALALAVLARPLHVRVAALVRSPDVAAGISVAAILIVLGVPTYLVLARLTSEAAEAHKAVMSDEAIDALRVVTDRVPALTGTLEWAQTQLAPDEIRKQLLAHASDLTTLLGGSLAAVFQCLLLVLALFYFLRDGPALLRDVRGLAPVSPAESADLSKRVRDAIDATVYGTFVTGMIQGVTGGLLFWALGLPAPVLWGAVMFVLGVLPLVGGVLVWAPAAAFLLFQSRWLPAAALVAWGVVMSGPISNFVYARCAGDRMKLHPLPTLFAYLGGLAVFGATGMVLGPVILALAVGAIAVWRGRMDPSVETMETHAPAA